MKSLVSNTFLFMAFAVAIGGAYHYKTTGQEGTILSQASAEDSKNADQPQKQEAVKGTKDEASEGNAEAVSEKKSSSQDPAVARERFTEAEKEFASSPMRAIFKLERILWDYPDTREASQAKSKLAAIAASAKKEGALAWKRQDYLGARKAYSRAFFASWSKSERRGMVKRLEEVNKKYLYSRKPVEGVEIYKVAPGDSLGAIAKKNGVSWLTLKRINKLKSSMIRIGQRLRFFTGSFAIEISKERFELVLTHNGDVLKHFDVAIGKEDRTPVGRFTIEERIIKPTWYGPDGVYPFGHEKNILGTRWLGFNRTEECSGFGIHGTKYPNSIGTAASMGCIRMRNGDVEDLFDYIPKGCVVTIR